MLRLLVLVLLLANVGVLAWGQGWLAGVGLGPVSQAEPQRVAQQLRPEAMRIVTGADASPPAPSLPQVAGALTADECLQAGLFTVEQAAALRARLQSSLPGGSWTLEPASEPGSWLVYMGKYNNPETFATKRSELRRLGVVFEVLPNGMGPALSLGQYSSAAEAQAGLARVAARGVISARVLQERPPAQGQRLTLPRVDAPVRAQLEAIKPLLEGKALEACR
jgi:hypothetical protein